MLQRKIVFVALSVALMIGSTASGWAQVYDASDYLGRASELYSLGYYREAQAELAKAQSAATGLRKVDEVVAEKVALLGAMCEAELGDGAAPLEAFVVSHPLSPYLNEALVALASEHYEWGRYEQAIASFERVNLDGVSDEHIERLCFECGHAYYQAGRSAEAKEWLGRLSRPGDLYDHARYLLGYMAYEEGHYALARDHFASLAHNDDYRAIVPYYLLNVHHRLGNDDYVVRNAEGVLEGVVGSRRAEILRVAAQSNFRAENWQKASEMIVALKAEPSVGALSREENYIAGYSLYKLGRWEDAASYLRGASGADDSLTRNAAYHLADCMLRWGDKRGAMQSFAMASTGGEENPVREDAYYNYCKLQVELGGSNFNEEIQSLSGYLRAFPRSRHRAEIEGYLISACYAANDLRGAYAVLGEFASSGGRVRAAMQKVAYYYAAECYSRGDMAEAEEYCNYALDHKEYDTETEALTLYLLGEIDYSQGKFKQAASMFDQYLAMEMTHQSEYPIAMYNMGYANFNASRFGAAYNDFADFVAEHTTEDSLWADAYNRMGDSKAASKEYSAAARLYERSAASSTPERYYGAYRVAMMEGMAGNVIARVEALEKIVRLGKGKYALRSHYELGNTLLSTGNYERAVSVLKEYVAKYPTSRDYVAALADLALAYRNTGNDDGALEAYKKIVTTARGSVAMHNALGEIRNIYIERNDVDGYVAYAESVGMSGEVDAPKRDSLGFVAAQRLYIAGDKASASTAFDKYLADNPEGAYSAAALYYGADCSATVGDTLAAREKLTRLTSLYYNNYTQRGYERLAQLAAAGADWKVASDAYRRLAEVATSPSERRAALEKYLSSAITLGNGEVTVEVADHIISHPEVTPELSRKALFNKAVALEGLGKRNPAVAIYSSLAEDVTTIEGAESNFRLIETAFRFGSFEKAEEMVYEFAEKNTPHAYWLARAFLLLGDVYVSRGDLFQARATYQSVVDGYSDGDDGIVEMARQKVEALSAQGETPVAN